MNADHKQALVMLARTFCSYRLNGSNDDRSRSPRLSCPLETAEGMPGARIAFLREVSNQNRSPGTKEFAPFGITRPFCRYEWRFLFGLQSKINNIQSTIINALPYAAFLV